MTINLNVNLKWPEIEAKFATILHILQGLRAQGEQMSVELDTLTAQVKANTDAEESAILLLNNLSALLIAAKDDPAKVLALANDLKGSASALGAAIVANTPPPAAP